MDGIWQNELWEGMRLSQSLASNVDSSFPMLLPKAYADLIDWKDNADPLRKLLVPSAEERNESGSFDTSGEAESTVVRGLQHKYDPTAVLLVNQACAGHCRYCFRRRLLDREILAQETISDLSEAFAYIANHPEIDNVLLSGGDPLLSNNRRIEKLLRACAEIPHIRQLRISTKLPAFLPSRFLSDPELLGLFESYSKRMQILVQCHFDHPRELRPETLQALDLLRASGVLLSSQVALMKGVNDNVEVLRTLFAELHYAGLAPQYLFHPRPVKHATHFQLPILRGLELVEEVRERSSGHP